MSYKNIIEAYGQTKLATELSIPTAQVHHWVKGVRFVPPKYCKQIVTLVDGVTLQMLRPGDWQVYWPELIPAVQIAEAGQGE